MAKLTYRQALRGAAALLAKGVNASAVVVGRRGHAIELEGGRFLFTAEEFNAEYDRAIGSGKSSRDLDPAALMKS